MLRSGARFHQSPSAQFFQINRAILALHELGYWSGLEPRLDRDLSARFGARAYAAEDLVVEFAAAFFCVHLGIAGELPHAGYIKDWLDLLRHDARAIFTAASKASQAADYLRSISEPFVLWLFVPYQV